MSDDEEIEPSPYRNCVIHDVLAFEPGFCFKCKNGPLCTECLETCETCGEQFCNTVSGDEKGGCLEHHGCKRAADPADVMMLEGAYLYNPVERLEAVYTINGRTYFELATVGQPPDVGVYRFDGVKEKDVWTTSSGPNGDGYVARQFVDCEEVGRFDGVLGRTVWDDDVAEADHREAHDDR